MIRSHVEKMIAKLSRHGDRTFFETASFSWVDLIESEWGAIRSELDALLVHQDEIPKFQDISEDQKVLTEANQWKTFFLYAYGHKIEQNCARCPETTRALGCIPRMKTAVFSILASQKHIPEHRGLYKRVLRYHLELIVPEPKTSCRIRVGSEVRCWEEGKSLIFDDTYMHEVWNDSDSCRVVLFVDFVRPLPFPLSLLNRIMIWRISRTPFVTDAVERIQNANLTGSGASLHRSRAR